MKHLYFVLSALAAIIIISSCQKTLYFDRETAATGTLVKNAAGDCFPTSAGGLFVTGKMLDTTNYIDVEVSFSVPGDYAATSDTINGYFFSGAGHITSAGTNTIRLQGKGTPTASGMNLFVIKLGASTCQASISVGTSTAIYNLGGSPADCTGVVLSGAYIDGTVLSLSNTATINVNVVAVGAYAILSDTVNGIFFHSSGIFSTTGAQTVALAGSGTPVTSGTFTHKLNGASGCSFIVPVANSTAFPTLTTKPVVNITCDGAVSGGVISGTGASAITARGICISTTPSPMIGQSSTLDGIGTGTFTSRLTDLHANTTYYVRAYATNIAGTAYGNEVSFSTVVGPCSARIYIAGYQDVPLATGGTRRRATYGQVYEGSWGANYLNLTGNGEANSVFLSGGTTYVAGIIGQIATLSIISNTVVQTPLSPGATISRANGVFVAGNEVYVVGSLENKTAVIWKNGNATSLANGNIESDAKSVYVSGGNVYVAGYEKEYVGATSQVAKIAKLWKNGQAVSLTNGTADAEATAVFVVDSDVYVSGHDGNTAMIWKNGVPASLPATGTSKATANSIFVSGDDVFVGGAIYAGTSANSSAVIWKNGLPAYLSSAGYQNSALSVFVLGADVYVAGRVEESTGNRNAIFWKNGAPFPLEQQYNGHYEASINSIYVK